MDEFKLLYQKLKEQKISHEDAMKQIKKRKSIPEVQSDSPALSSCSEQADTVLLAEKAVIYFKKLLSSVLKLPVNRIEAKVPMEDYGIDSVMVMQLTNQLETIFGSLPKTLFFEYQDIQSLTGYFLESHNAKLTELLGVAEKASNQDSTETIYAKKSVKSGVCNRRHPRYIPQSRDTLQEQAGVMDIAIIGMSGRYPQAKGLLEYWENLKAGKDCITEIPKDRWDHSLYYDEDRDKPGKTYSKWGGFLDGVDQFDPAFFNIAPREAEIMDPQERLFLECAYAAIEDSGYTRETLGRQPGSGQLKNVGVYVGVMFEEYQLYGAQEQVQGRAITLGGNSATIANRVSYFCNFHGPSIAVNTMCSSSLTAIHLACQSLQRGECELALAGGVNLSVHPNKYLALGQGKFVSSKGRCESFGQGGDGYVPGEGVGAVVLKPLSQAVADNDHIYGIIKATAVNHGGKTNGYTVPNPNVQAAVIERAFKTAGINPRLISYIEAHGTGTSLGDPIEIAGLTKAFQAYTKDKQFCAIGSAKSNIGHCESAAGIAGVAKVLLQLTYGQLVPSLHSQTLNPNIDFANTPFFVQQELTDWQRPVVTINGVSKPCPRLAGISSFGAGGSNAHVVIEEYIGRCQDRLPIPITPQNPAIIVLSAKKEERLTAQVHQLLAALSERRISDNNLADIAYTLQIGREAMEERLAVLAVSVKELEEKLQAFLHGQADIEDLYRGQVKRNKESIAVFADDDMAQTVEAWFARKKYAKVIETWVKGLPIDWNMLYKESKPCRISLPTYPFARERYWLPETAVKADHAASVAAATVIHPLLHRNTSDFSQQKFTSSFTGEETFLAEHVISGRQFFPGLAYLEMVRVAAAESAGLTGDENDAVRFKNVVWPSHRAIGSRPVQLTVGLCPEYNGEISFTVFSENEAVDAGLKVYSQGSIALGNVEKIQPRRLAAIQAECNGGVLTAEQCYKSLRTKGIEHGPGYKVIEEVLVGPRQLLAKLSLPSRVLAAPAQYVLHPAIMDAVLQVLSSLKTDSAGQQTLFPVALSELAIVKAATTAKWVLVYWSAVDTQEPVREFDIELCDEAGNLCVRMSRLKVQEQVEVITQDNPAGPLSEITDSKIVSMGDFDRQVQPEGVAGQAKAEARPDGPGRRPEMKGLSTEQCLEWDLKEHISQLLKIPRDQLDREDNLEDYGFDSVSLAKFAQVLTNQLELKISPSVFFGYPTLVELTEYLLSEYRSVMEEFYWEGSDVQQVLPEKTVTVTKPKPRAAVKSRYRNNTLTGNLLEPIAIIGMSGRFPGARDIDELWRILAEGREVIAENPDNRFADMGFKQDKWKCGWLPGVREFDSLFFEISPREAEIIDPRQRLLLQEAWRALEDAGYGKQQLTTNKIGMFVGVEDGDYHMLVGEDRSVTANHNGILAARLAYFLNLTGPNMAINTACSSGLVAVHQACQSLRNQECDTAIAASVNFMLTPAGFIAMSQAGMLSAEGRCYAFDKRANGMVPGEAVAVVVLKRLAKAQADRDPIYAVIQGSGINYDGKTNGITAPSGVSQSSLLRSVYERYQVNPEEIEYIVTHGTGTKLGDPIEINALYDVFKGYTSKQRFCALTSTKPNVGHTLAASGMVSLISLVQALRHETIPASLHCQQESDYINWEESPFYVNKTITPWLQSTKKRRTGAVSAFGMSGTNAHLVLQSYLPENESSIDQAPYYLLAISAKTREALLEKVRDMIGVFEKSGQKAGLAELSYTLLEGRQHFSHRCAVVVRDTENALHVLKQIEGKEKLPNLFQGKVARDFKGQRAIENYAEELLEQSRLFWADRNKYQETLYALADLYCQGYEISWDKLFGDCKPCRIHLPAYPFARNNYWVSQKVAAAAGQVVTPAALPARSEKTVLGKEWHPTTIEVQNNPAQTGIVVILATTGTEKLAPHILADQAGIQIVQAVHGEKSLPQSLGTDYYSYQQGEQLYRQIKERQLGQKLLGIIDITAYDSQYEQSLAVEAGKIAFLQKMIEADRSDGLRILQVTHNLQGLQLAATTMQGARLVGLYRMLGAEYKQVYSMAMDSDYTLEECQLLAGQIATEFWHLGQEVLTECCYRNTQRYEPRLTVVQTAAQIQEKQRLSERYNARDVILITGGTGGIGVVVARHLVSQGVKNLVLMGREALPDCKDWATILQNDSEYAGKNKLKDMQYLVEQGVRLHYYNTALTDQAGLRDMLDKVHQELGPVTGVFHCAGVPSKSPVFFKKPETEFVTVCEPKVQGVVNLHTLLMAEPLAFFIVFSSIAGIVPTLAAGQSDYAMANAFMDCYAQYQAGLGKAYFKAVQWPAWGQTGMAKGSVRTPAYVKTGIGVISDSDGLDFLDSISQTSQIVNFPCTFTDACSCDQLLQAEIAPPAEYASIAPQPELRQKSAVYQAPPGLRADVVDWLKQIFMAELKLTPEQLEEDKTFDEYGVDSIILAQLVQPLQAVLKTQVDPALLLEHSTIVSLADYFMQNHLTDLQKILGPAQNNETKGADAVKAVVPETVVQSVGEQKRDSNRVLIVEQTISGNGPACCQDDIAVVGIACRFPGAPNKDAYWDLMLKGQSAIKPVPPGRWKVRNGCTDYGGWLDGPEQFAAKFFNIKEKDAAIMDPQAKLLLAESLQAVYDAGYEHNQLAGENIGVFIGGRSHNNVPLDVILQAPNPILGIGQNYMAANISRFFDWKGPSLVVDTACSSGLTGLLLASQFLKNRQIDMALAGAVNLLPTPFVHDMFAARNILSKNGEFHIFDIRSSGEVLGEGAGVVLLKRLSDAIREGNHIYGVVKAISTNNDGRTLGPGSPSIQAQKQIMRQALQLSGKQCGDIGYIEVNGGGTPVIDALEIKALAEVYRLDDQGLPGCAVGSVKPNIGHTLLAAGMAGFIRCVLSLYHRQIPPFLSANKPFQHYNFRASRIRFNHQPIAWSVPDGQKRVAVQNSMPDGGTNCHIVLEEFVPEGIPYHCLYQPRTAPAVRENGVNGLEKEKPENSDNTKTIKNKWGEYNVSGLRGEQ